MSSSFSPFIRRYNYASDYYKTVYELYTDVSPAYPCTYYNIDWDKSVYDESLMGGSYERGGLGELSGIKYRKIQMLPIYNVESIQPSYDGSETGFNMKESEQTSITFPSSYGIIPYPWDIVFFDQAFMFRGQETAVAFVVKNKELSTYGDITHYRLRLEAAGSGRGDAIRKVEDQVVDKYVFLEVTKKTHPSHLASLLLTLQDRNDTLTENINTLIHTTGFFLQS